MLLRQRRYWKHDAAATPLRAEHANTSFAQISNMKDFHPASLALLKLKLGHGLTCVGTEEIVRTAQTTYNPGTHDCHSNALGIMGHN